MSLPTFSICILRVGEFKSNTAGFSYLNPGDDKLGSKKNPLQFFLVYTWWVKKGQVALSFLAIVA